MSTKSLTRAQADRLQHLAELPTSTYEVPLSQVAPYLSLQVRGLLTLRYLDLPVFINGKYRPAVEVSLTTTGLTEHLRILTDKTV